MKQKYNLENQTIVFVKSSNTNTKKIASLILLFAIVLGFFNLFASIDTVQAAPPASYIDITTTPFSRTVTQAEFNVANEIWFRFVTAQDIILGSYTNKGGTFSPLSRIFQSDGSTTIVTFGDGGWWYQLAAGTYYIRITRSGGGASNFDFTSNFKTAPLNPSGIPNGSYLIPDDTNNPQLAATVYEPDGDLFGFFDAIPTGEIGDALPSGHVLIHDRFGKYANNSVVLFGPDLAHIATIVPTPALSGWPRIVNDGTSFYVINSGGADWGDIHKVEIDGSITKIGTLPLADSPVPVGISRDGDTVYWEEDTGTIKRYSISTSTQLPDLYTIPGYDSFNDDVALTPNFNPGEIIVLGDDSLVTWWTDSSAAKDFVLHISSDGTLLNSIEYAHPIKVNHIHYSSGANPNSISIWFFLDNFITQGRIGELNLTTGNLDSSFDANMFYGGGNGSDDPNEFGPSNSCPFVIMGYSITDPTSYDLEIEKTVDDATPDEDGTIVYTLSLTNNGPDDATSLEVADTLPAEITYVSSLASQGTYDENTGIWTVGDLSNTQVATLDITVTVNTGTAGNSFDNTATADPDTDSSVNTSTVSVTVNTPPPPPPPPPPSSGGGGGGYVFVPPPPVEPPAPLPTFYPPWESPDGITKPATTTANINPPATATPTNPPLPRTGIMLLVIPGYAAFYVVGRVINKTARSIYLQHIRIRKVVLNNQWLTYTTEKNWLTASYRKRQIKKVIINYQTVEYLSA